MSSLRTDFHTNLATSFQEGVLYQQKYLYYFLGNTVSWSDDTNPPSVPIVSGEGDISVRDNILYMGKVGQTDASLVIPRYNWIDGYVFDQWDQTKDMTDRQFYCVTDEFNVYKCLYNNAGEPSTVKPSGTSLFPFKTSDGYLWKFMYNVAPFKRPKFVSSEFIPVQKALTESFYNKGSIERVVVNNGGSNYIDTALTSIEVIGTTSGVGAIARVSSIGQDGEITSLQVINPGIGYIAGSSATVVSQFGQGADIKTINSTQGELVGFDIIKSGFNYKVGDSVSITVGGAVLTPVVSKTTGSIIDIVINNPGIGYNADVRLQVKQFGNSGTGRFGNDSAIIRARVFNGSIEHVIIDDPGIGYPSDAATSITVEGDGAGAIFSPIISNGIISSVYVENPGVNYTYAKLYVVGQGSGAILTPILTGSEISTTQSIIEQTTVDGAIYSIEVENGGEGYSYVRLNILGDGVDAKVHARVSNGRIVDVVIDNAGSGYTNAVIDIESSTGYAADLVPIIQDGKITAVQILDGGAEYTNTNVIITGDGIGATATALVTIDGSIERIFMNSYGEGYTFATVTFTDPQRPSPSTLEDASAYAVLPPYKGHGYDAPKELFANTVCIFSTLRSDAELIESNQTYRQYGLIENPSTLFSGKRFAGQSTFVFFKIAVRSSAGLIPNVTVVCNRRKYRVITIDANTITLAQIGSIYQQPAGSFYIENDISNQFEILSVESAPTVDKYSGNLLYVSNKPPFTITDTQSVAIRTYLRF